MRNIVSIDTQLGISLQTAGEMSKIVTSLYDSYIFGETEAQDCPADHDCYCAPKKGLLAFGGNHGGKTPHITSQSALPLRKIKSYGAWAAQTYSKGNTFKNWIQKETQCGAS